MNANQLFSRENLQQADKHAAIAKVSVKITDPAGHSTQMGVHPFSKGLLLYCLSLIWK